MNKLYLPDNPPKIGGLLSWNFYLTSAKTGVERYQWFAPQKNCGTQCGGAATDYNQVN